jgi:hypothetical protein
MRGFAHAAARRLACFVGPHNSALGGGLNEIDHPNVARSRGSSRCDSGLRQVATDRPADVNYTGDDIVTISDKLPAVIGVGVRAAGIVRADEVNR